MKTKKKVFIKNRTLFSPNSGEDKKKVFNKNRTRFFLILRSDVHPFKLLGGIQPNYWGDISPHPPLFRHPCIQLYIISYSIHHRGTDIKFCSYFFWSFLSSVISSRYLLLHCPLFREGCRGSSSRLSRHTSRSSITSIISLGRSPKQFHSRSSM